MTHDSAMMVSARTMPPCSELSPPFMAFWTALEIRRMATNSVGLISEKWRFPASRRTSSTTRYTVAARATSSATPSGTLLLLVDGFGQVGRELGDAVPHRRQVLPVRLVGVDRLGGLHVDDAHAHDKLVQGLAEAAHDQELDVQH